MQSAHRGSATRRRNRVGDDMPDTKPRIDLIQNTTWERGWAILLGAKRFPEAVMSATGLAVPDTAPRKRNPWLVGFMTQIGTRAGEEGWANPKVRLRAAPSRRFSGKPISAEISGLIADLACRMSTARRPWRKNAFTGTALACAFLAFSGGGSAMAIGPDQFRARTTADLVALCAADPAEENYVAAIHFCHGFATGAYQYYLSLVGVSEANRFVCPPDPVPSRSQIIADYIAWTRQNSQFMSDPPVDSIFRYLAHRYPCTQ